MEYGHNEKKQDSVYSKRLKAGKRRTYFFDVRETKGNDYYLIITESRKRFNEDGYDRHKIFLYKEDFNKFVKGLNEAVDYIKTELMPDYDFDAFNHDNADSPYSPADSSTTVQSDESKAEEISPKQDVTSAADTDKNEFPESTTTDKFTGSSSISGVADNTSSSTEDVDKW
ncbi:MAG: DUF3276 family protein [Arachidicoccus sp.]|nr:DUF3276 family protein [Arachidicoccus sp.]